MASRDILNSIKVTPAINPGAAITGNAATNGAVIDTQGFESVTFAVQSGTITDGSFAVKIQEGDQPTLSDASDVVAGDYIGAAISFAAAANNLVKKIGYRGSHRYIRAVLTQAGATNGGVMSAVAILGNAHNNPVA